MEIIELLKQPESKILEFKRNATSTKGILKSIIAFANTAGGVLIIGVEDHSKEICGVKQPLHLEEKLANIISDSVYPRVVPEIEIIPYRNTYIIALKIHPSSTRPHYLKTLGEKKSTYIRVGSTNRLADQVMLKELKRYVLDESFDEQPCPELSSEAIDFRAASELFKPVCKLTRSNLETLNIITDYQGKKIPTTGGILLFCTQRDKYFPDAWIQAGRFAGTTKTDIIDSQEIRSLPVTSIEDAMLFVKKHAIQGIKTPGSGYGGGLGAGAGFGDGSGDGRPLAKHINIWNVPLAAIRETIINAVVHADYEQRGAPIRLAIFDNRIEVENPGLLKFGLTIDDIKRGVSKLRNRVIGRVFHKIGLIERWGSGITRIIESCSDAGLSEPEFEEIGTHFRVTIFTEQRKQPRLDAIDQQILKKLKQCDTNGVTTEGIAKIIKLSKRAARSRMLTLISKGLVIEIGLHPKDPYKKYFLTKK